MNIRRARQEDKETFWSIQVRAIRELGTSHYNQEQVAAWAGDLTPEESHARAMERFERSIDHDSVFVAEDDDGTVAGFSSLVPETGEVSMVYVDPGYIRRGIGRQLIEAVEEEAHHLGITELHLRGSLNAVAFYERVGFRIDHEIIHCMRSGIEIPCVIMKKVLSGS